MISRQRDQLRRGLRGLEKEGFRRVHILRSEDEVDAVELVRTKLFNDRREPTGPFDVFGDVHGCAAELELLLTKLGYELRRDDERPGGRRAAPGRAGPRSSWATSWTGARTRRACCGWCSAWCATATRCAFPATTTSKLLRALRGRKVTVSHGLAESLAQLGPGARGVPGRGGVVPRRADLALRAGRRQARGQPRGPDRAAAGPGLGSGAVSSACTARRPARPTSSGCRSGIRGRTNIAARRWCCTGTPRYRCRGVGERDVVPGHRLRVRRAADRDAVSRSGSWCRCAAARVYYEPAKPFPANAEVAGLGGVLADETGPMGRPPVPLALPAGALQRVSWNGDFAAGEIPTCWISPMSPAAGESRRLPRPDHGQGGERGRRARGNEQVRARPALAALPAADDEPGRDLARGGLA